MQFHLQSLIVFLWLCGLTTAFPPYAPLAGRSDEEIEAFARTVTVVGALPPPGPDPNTLSMLVNDDAHPFQPAGPNDIRGPCPGLNTLASHGVSFFAYLLGLFILSDFAFSVPQPKWNRNSAGNCESSSER